MSSFTPRAYQQSIVDTAKLHNTLVVLPTGLGKTHIALMLAQHRIERYPTKKILMLAPTRPLVEQHQQTFQDHVADAQSLSTLLTGRISPDKRKKAFDNASFIFSTPQTVQNDLLTKRINLEDVALLVIDEAHRAVGEYAYVYIVEQYRKQADQERILSLTASPGSSNDAIKQVIQNTAAERVEVRSHTDKDVAPYVKETKIKYLEVEFPSYFKQIRDSLKRIVHSRLSEVRRYGFVNRIELSRTQLLMVQKELQARIREGQPEQTVWRSLSLLAEVMKIQHALELIETQGVAALLAYLQSLEQQAAKGQSKAVKSLVQDVSFRTARVKAQSLAEKRVEHPKFLKLLALAKVVLSKNTDPKIIIFNQYRDMAQQIVKELGSSARLFVGQQKKGGTGLSQKEQKAMLDDFRAGEFPVLVATAVGEEGLDIPSVDIVIFYEPVPSGIRTIQRRGRTGRQDKGNVYVLLTKDTREVAYRWSAHHKEKQMYRNLKNIASTASPPPKQKQLEEFSGPEIEIIADAREKSSSVLKELQQLNVDITMRALDVGDYLLSKRVCVEFKTARDFVDSLLDGRLLEQLAKMTVYQRPIVIVQGSNWYEQRNVHPNAIRGLLSVIAVSYGVPIIVTQNEKDTAAMLHTIARREASGGVGKAEVYNAKPQSDKDHVLQVIASFPNVGPVLAPKLLERFGSIKQLVNTSIEELRDVDGIGKKKATQLHEFFEKVY